MHAPHLKAHGYLLRLQSCENMRRVIATVRVSAEQVKSVCFKWLKEKKKAFFHLPSLISVQSKFI